MQGADLVGREVLGASVGLLGLALRQVAACLAIVRFPNPLASESENLTSLAIAFVSHS